MEPTDIEETLDKCLSELREGGSAADCLRRYQQQAAELAPLLRTAEKLDSVAAIYDGEARDRVWAAIEQNLDLNHRPAGRLHLLPLSTPRFAKVAAVVVMMAAISFGAARVSAGQLPGSPLYPLKRGLENAQLSLTFDKKAKAEVKVTLVERRLDELDRLSGATGTVNEDLLKSLPAEMSGAIDDLANLPAADRTMLAAQLEHAWQHYGPPLQQLEEGQDASVREHVDELSSIAKRASDITGQRSESPVGSHGEDKAATPPVEASPTPAAVAPASTSDPEGQPEAEPESNVTAPTTGDEEAEPAKAATGEDREAGSAAEPEAASPEPEQMEISTEDVEAPATTASPPQSEESAEPEEQRQTEGSGETKQASPEAEQESTQESRPQPVETGSQDGEQQVDSRQATIETESSTSDRPKVATGSRPDGEKSAGTRREVSLGNEESAQPAKVDAVNAAKPKVERKKPAQKAVQSASREKGDGQTKDGGKPKRRSAD